MNQFQYDVAYTCTVCGQVWHLLQGDPEPDDELTYCWACIDAIFASDAHGTRDDPWTPSKVRAVRGLVSE